MLRPHAPDSGTLCRAARTCAALLEPVPRRWNLCRAAVPSAEQADLGVPTLTWQVCGLLDAFEPLAQAADVQGGAAAAAQVAEQHALYAAKLDDKLREISQDIEQQKASLREESHREESHRLEHHSEEGDPLSGGGRARSATVA